MQDCQHPVGLGQNLVREVESGVFENVTLDTLQNPDPGGNDFWTLSISAQ